MSAYYNEFDPYAAQWLRNLIAAGHIAPGEVDSRSILEVSPDDLKGFTQCHFFAGIGGWSYAARLAGWPDERPLWTGSCPCQPFSVAGKGEGQKDERHLWPIFFALIDSCRPDVVMGEQVAAAVRKDWLDGVHSDLEGIGYACGATVVPACAVDAPHRRDRLWFVADRDQRESRQIPGDTGEVRCLPQVECGPEFSAVVPVRGREIRHDHVDDTLQQRLERQPRHGHNGDQSGRFDTNEAGPTSKTGGSVSDPECPRPFSAPHTGVCGEAQGERPWHEQSVGRVGAWDDAAFAIGADGKARRIEPSIRLLAHGVPARVGKLRAYGNAIVPQVAAEIIGAFMEVRP